MKTESDANRAKMAETDAKLAACAPGAAPVPTEPAKAGKAHTGKTAKAPAAPKAPTVDTAAPAGTQANPVVVPAKKGAEY
jgi:hypothetical protein